MVEKLFCVYTSDAMALDGTISPASTLACALERIWDSGVPSCIGHDLHRSFGWSRPLGLYFEPGLTRLFGITYVAETQSESNWISNEVYNSINLRIQRDCYPHADELRRRIADRLTGEEKILECSGTALIRSNLAVEVFSRIFAQKDNDGLIPLASLEYLGDGVFRSGELLLYAHPYFRRSLSRLNNANDELLKSLLKAQETVDVKIALDTDMVGLASTFIPKLEHEYWWGPMFDDELISIVPGVTRHCANERDKLFHAINWTDFFWYSRDGEHTFEAEELRDIPSFGHGDDLYGCRYVHSIIDEASGIVKHFDGAVKEYTEEQMIMRLDVDLSRAERDAKYTKLWRLDGHISVPLWKEIITHHFRDNHLVGEYLGGRETNPRVASTLVLERTEGDNTDGQLVRSNVPDVVPGVPFEGTGPRMAVSFRPVHETPHLRTIIPLETWNTENSSIEIIESDIVEIIKILKRGNSSVELSPGSKFYIVEDLYTNFPLIYHKDPNTMKTTILAFQELVSIWNESADDRVININLSFENGAHAVCISLLGHIRDLPPILEVLFNACDSMTEGDYSWCTRIADFLDQSYPESVDIPHLQDLWTSNGRLCIKRKLVDYTRYNFELATDGSMKYKMEIPKSEESLGRAITSGSLRVCWAGWYTSKCSKCGGEYSYCRCSKYFDNNTHEVMTSMHPVGFFWTDRLA